MDVTHGLPIRSPSIVQTIVGWIATFLIPARVIWTAPCLVRMIAAIVARVIWILVRTAAIVVGNPTTRPAPRITDVQNYAPAIINLRTDRTLVHAAALPIKAKVEERIAAKATIATESSALEVSNCTNGLTRVRPFLLHAINRP